MRENRKKKKERDGAKEPFMGMEPIADYPGSVLWRGSLFKTTLGLHGFVHLHPSSHMHTHINTRHSEQIGVHHNTLTYTDRFGNS